MSVSRIKKPLLWIVGLFLLFGGFTDISSGKFFAGFFFTLSSFFVIPYTYKFINEKFSFALNSGLRAILSIVLFAVGIGVTPSSEPYQNTEPIRNTESLSEKTTQSSEKPVVNESVDTEKSSSEKGTVVSIADGDTITASVNGEKMKIRLIGIDTPEISHPTEPIQCYGPEAKEALTNLILNKEVILEKDVSDTDKYDRYLRYIWIGETLVNEYLTLKGFAFASSYPPDTKYQTRIDSAQQQAETMFSGLWNSETCNGNVYTGTYKDPNKLSQPSVGGATTTYPETESTYVGPVVPISSGSGSNTSSGSTSTSASTYTPPPEPTPPPSSSSGFTCSCSKTCSKMASCEEAYFQLNECGCGARDGDGDGIPCESICD